MALFHAHFFSEVLGRQVAAEVIVPQSTGTGQIGIQTAAARESWPCLWLLHGMSDDHTIWLRRTGIERYAEAAGCAVVMPDGQRSYYCDMHRGGAFWTYLSQELPARMRGFFPLSADPKQQAVARMGSGRDILCFEDFASAGLAPPATHKEFHPHPRLSASFPAPQPPYSRPWDSTPSRPLPPATAADLPWLLTWQIV